MGLFLVIQRPVFPSFRGRRPKNLNTRHSERNAVKRRIPFFRHSERNVVERRISCKKKLPRLPRRTMSSSQWRIVTETLQSLHSFWVTVLFYRDSSSLSLLWVTVLFTPVIQRPAFPSFRGTKCRRISFPVIQSETQWSEESQIKLKQAKKRIVNYIVNYFCRIFSFLYVFFSLDIISLIFHLSIGYCQLFYYWHFLL